MTRRTSDEQKKRIEELVEVDAVCAACEVTRPYSDSKESSQISASVTRREKKIRLASAGILGGPITSRVTEKTFSVSPDSRSTMRKSLPP